MFDKNFVKLLNFFILLTVLSWIVLISEISTENDFKCIDVTSENENHLKANFVSEEYKVWEFMHKFQKQKIYSRRILEVVKSKSKAKHPPEHLKNLCQFVVERCNLYKRLKRKIKNIVTGEVGNLFMLNRPSGTKIKEIEHPELQGTEDGPHKTIRIVPVAGHEIHGKLENFYLLVENAAFMKCIVSTRKESFSFSLHYLIRRQIRYLSLIP